MQIQWGDGQQLKVENEVDCKKDSLAFDLMTRLTCLIINNPLGPFWSV